MPYQLQLSDSNAMMYSITTRNPLLDFRQIYNINNELNFKFHKGYNKYLLRKIIPNYIYDEIRWRRDKQPFRWFGDEILFNKNHDIIKTQIIESKLLSNFYKQEDLLNIYKKTY